MEELCTSLMMVSLGPNSLRATRPMASSEAVPRLLNSSAAASQVDDVQTQRRQERLEAVWGAGFEDHVRDAPREELPREGFRLMVQQIAEAVDVIRHRLRAA